MSQGAGELLRPIPCGQACELCQDGHPERCPYAVAQACARNAWDDWTAEDVAREFDAWPAWEDGTS